MYQTSLPRCAAVGLVVFLFAVLLTPLVLHGQAKAVSVPDSSSNHNVIPVVVKDINTTDQGSQPGPKIILNGVAYFAAFDGWHGTELWRSDGTAAGTWLVKDVYEGSGSSSPEQLVATDDKLFFVADDGIHGQELWMSDGTSSGTVLVKDLTPDSLHTGIDQVTAISDTLYFQTTSYPHGFKLWKSDGTLTGTVPLSYYRPSGLTNVAGWLYFAASNADSSIYGLWKTDGTSSGTVLLGQFPDFDGARPSGLTNVNGTMYFKAAKPISPTGYQYGLWRSDGTISGTYDIPIAGIVEVDDLTAVDDALFFTVVVNNGPDLLAKTDGTLTGTVELTRLQPIFNLTNVSGTLYFTRGDAELWKSDGTPADTVMLKDGFDFSWCNSYPPCGILELMAVGDRLYFRSSDGSTHGSELWTSDGTPAGTIQVKDVFPGSQSSFPSDLLDLNGTLLFTADDGLYGPELWRSDGTGTATRLVTNIFNGTGHASPGSFVQVSDTVYFAAFTDSAGRELWKTNGSATTTVLISDINPSGSSSPSSLVGMNGNIFFRALSSQEECGLWRSDGTLTGTTLIKSFLFEYACTPLLVANGQLFWTDIDESDSGLWKSDGTPEGTELVKAFDYDYPPRLRVLGGVNGWLLFANDGFGSDRGLWRSDGTYSGTTLLKYFDPAPSGSVEMGGLLYFAVGYENGQLWKSDGTAAGTLLVFSGTTYLQGSTLMPVNDQLFFVAKDPVNNWGLWKSDGTLTGTLLVKGQFHGGAGTQPKYLANVNGTLFFEASAMTGYGHELWKSDGTPEGTVMVKDIRPMLNVYDSGSSYPQALTAVGGKLYFAADDGLHGDELWISDGTVTGTYLAADVYPGPVGSDPGSLFYADGTLYFSAKDILLGRELWKLIQVNYRSYLPIISCQ